MKIKPLVLSAMLALGSYGYANATEQGKKQATAQEKQTKGINEILDAKENEIVNCKKGLYEKIDQITNEIMEQNGYDFDALAQILTKTRENKEKSYGLEATQRDKPVRVRINVDWNSIVELGDVSDERKQKIGQCISRAERYIQENIRAKQPLDTTINLRFSSGYLARDKERELITAKALRERNEIVIFEDGFRNEPLLNMAPEMYTAEIVHEFIHLLDGYEKNNKEFEEMNSIFSDYAIKCVSFLDIYEKNKKMSNEKFMELTKELQTDPLNRWKAYQNNNPNMKTFFKEIHDGEKVPNELKINTMTELRAYEQVMKFYANFKRTGACNQEIIKTLARGTVQNFIIEYHNVKIDILNRL